MGASLRVRFVRFHASKAEQALNGDSKVGVARSAEICGDRDFARHGVVERQAVGAEAQERGLMGCNAMPMQLPAAFPPEMGFDAYVILAKAISQAIE